VGYEEWSFRRSYFILDLKTGDMEIQDLGSHYINQLPGDLRTHIESASLPLDEKQRFIRISPTFPGRQVSVFGGEMASGVYFPSFYEENFKALGLWLQVDPSKFTERLQQYQRYFLRASTEHYLPMFYPIPEDIYGRSQKSGYIEEDEIFDVNIFRSNEKQILDAKIDAPTAGLPYWAKK
jgi:hypothetical protein